MREMATEEALEFLGTGTRNGVPGECVIRLRRASIAGYDGIADWD